MTDIIQDYVENQVSIKLNIENINIGLEHLKSDDISKEELNFITIMLHKNIDSIHTSISILLNIKERKEGDADAVHCSLPVEAKERTKEG